MSEWFNGRNKEGKEENKTMKEKMYVKKEKKKKTR